MHELTLHVVDRHGREYELPCSGFDSESDGRLLVYRNTTDEDVVAVFYHPSSVILVGVTDD